MDRKRRTILDLMEDPQWFAQFFQGESWTTWKVFLKALFGLKMTTGDAEAFRKYTRRISVPNKPAHEAWAIMGDCPEFR